MSKNNKGGKNRSGFLAFRDLIFGKNKKFETAQPPKRRKRRRKSVRQRIIHTIASRGTETRSHHRLTGRVPIYQTTSYVFKSTEHAANLFALKEFGNIYSRIMNPTNDVLEQRIAAIEGGTGALTVSSRAGCSYLCVCWLSRDWGDEIVASNNLYGGNLSASPLYIPQAGSYDYICGFPAARRLSAAAITPKTRAHLCGNYRQPETGYTGFRGDRKNCP